VKRGAGTSSRLLELESDMSTPAVIATDMLQIW
jgi:hypothetical protein